MKFIPYKSEGFTEDDLKTWIEAVEEELEVRLPEDYRNHMLENNGGIADGERVIFDSYAADVAVPEDIILRRFHYLEDGEGPIEEDAEFGGVDFIPFGLEIAPTYSGILMISLSKGDYGSIFHMNSDEDEPDKLTNSWSEFVSYLKDVPEE